MTDQDPTEPVRTITSDDKLAAYGLATLLQEAVRDVGRLETALAHRLGLRDDSMPSGDMYHVTDNTFNLLGDQPIAFVEQVLRNADIKVVDADEAA